MSKDPSPKADGLRAMREASRGHLQATASELVPFAGKERHQGGVPFTKTPRPAKPPAKRGKKR